MGVLVETGELSCGFLGAADHHLRQGDLVDKPGGQRGFPEERLGQPVACWYADRVSRSFMISNAAYGMVMPIATSLAWMLYAWAATR